MNGSADLDLYQRNKDLSQTRSPTMLVQRALITATLGPVALFLIYKGGWYYFLPITAIIMMATIEYTQIMQRLGWRPSLWILLPTVLVQLVVGQWLSPELFAPALVVSLLVVLAYALWLYEREVSQTVPSDWLAMMGGLFLLGWVGSHFFRLRGLGHMAWQWTLLAMLGTWAADTAAYLVGSFVAGRFIGRHQLSPRLSPNKTVEGYASGVIMGPLVTLLVARFLQLPLNVALILGFLVAAVSPIGDLGISMLKRQAGIKDSGTLFLGLGGALDRIDSLVWSVTMAYYLVLAVS